MDKHIATLEELAVGVELDAAYDPAAQRKLEAIRAAIALMRGQSDMVLVPRELTYENGAKAAFMGEFFVETTIPCGDCDGSGYEDEDGDVPCVICDGEGYVPYRLPVGWTLVKEIHKAIIVHFHPSPKDTADEQ